MPKIIPQTELDAIVEIISGISEPVSLEQIFSHLQNRLPRRTLQRRLALLVKNGRLTGVGKRGGRRYHVPSVKERPTEEKLQEVVYREIIDLERYRQHLNLKRESLVLSLLQPTPILSIIITPHEVGVSSTSP